MYKKPRRGQIARSTRISEEAGSVHADRPGWASEDERLPRPRACIDYGHVWLMHSTDLTAHLSLGIEVTKYMWPTWVVDLSVCRDARSRLRLDQHIAIDQQHPGTIVAGRRDMGPGPGLWTPGGAEAWLSCRR